SPEVLLEGYFFVHVAARCRCRRRHDAVGRRFRFFGCAVAVFYLFLGVKPLCYVRSVGDRERRRKWSDLHVFLRRLVLNFYHGTIEFDVLVAPVSAIVAVSAA